MTPKALLELARPFTLLAPAVGVVSGAYVACAATSTAMPWMGLGLAVLTALLVTAASNAWNQVFDVAIDLINKPGRPMPSGRIRAEQAMLFGHVSALLGLVLAWWVGATFFACVAVGVLATWIYSAPPLRTKRHTWGALVTIAIPRGLLVPVAGWSVVVEPRGVEPWALGLVSGLFVLGAAATKDFADVEGDARHACATLPARIGARAAAHLVAPFLVLPFLLYPLFSVIGWLQPPARSLWTLALILSGLGVVAATSLVRNPEAMGQSHGNHTAWAAMYLLLLAMHIGCAVVYQTAL